VDPHHDGIMFKPALDVSTGSMLFRDTFTQYGALTTIIQAASLAIFGKYLITIKFVTVFFYGLISIFLYLIFKRILPKVLVFTVLIIWIFLAPFYILTFLPWSSVYALFFQLLGVWFLLIAFENKLCKLIFIAGASISLAFWCRQPVGILTFVAVIAYFVYLFISKQINTLVLKKYIFLFLIGNLLIGIIFFTWLVANHALIDWWKQSILLPILWAMGQHAPLSIANSVINTSEVSGIGIAISNDRGIYIINSGIFPYLVRIIIYGWPLLLTWIFIKNSKRPFIVLLVFVSLVSGFQIFPAHDIRHCYWGFTPMLGLIALLIFQLVNDYFVHNFKISGKVIEYLSIFIFLLIFSPLFNIYMKEGLKKINTKYLLVEQPAVLKNMRLTKDEVLFYKDIYQKIEDYFSDCPKGNVITRGDALYLTFDTKIKNFHPMYVNWGYLNKLIYPDYPGQLSKYIAIHKPLILEFMPDPLKRNNV
jgi:4-amino-4-deoxy-L-arabinose transferase-like glycosyltransferase